MTRMAFLLLSAAVCAPAQDRWYSLFNGRNFVGWKINENQQTFTIQNGAIVAHGEPSHCFYSGRVGNHDFQDFELKLDVLTLPGSNGGIYFQTEYQNGWPEKGFEVQINNTQSDPIKTGSLYHVQDISSDDIKDLVKDNEWFTTHIVVQGNTVTVFLNGTEVVEWTQPDGWQGTSDYPERRIGHGTIALQGHDPDSTVYYKNIQIRPL